jgi:hypothetical protein
VDKHNHNTTYQQYDFELCKIGPGASNETARILEERYKHRLHVRFQKRKNSRLCSDLEPLKNNKKSTTTKHNLQRRTTSNHNSHPLHNEKPGKKVTATDSLSIYIGCSLGQKEYEKPKNASNKKTT